MKIILSFGNGVQRQDVLLSDVPRVGDFVRLKNNGREPSLVVQSVVWMEAESAAQEPTVILVVDAYSPPPVVPAASRERG